MKRLTLLLLAIGCAQQPAAEQPQPQPEAEPQIEWQRIEVAPKTDVVVPPIEYQKVTRRILVSEAWCGPCVAAKKRFLSSGGKQSDIITISQAMSQYGIKVTAIPYEFTTTENAKRVALINPRSYRYQPVGESSYNGTHTPTKSAILDHLRTAPQHKTKPWQVWYLESWNVAQLIALHDDDHNGVVPFAERMKELE